MIAEALPGLTDQPGVFLLIIVVVLIGLGMVLEPTSALLIVTPILLPVALEYGIDPLQFGSIVILCLMIGLLTPPMGGVCFVLSSVTGVPLERVFRGVVPFYPALLLTLLLVTYVPAVTLWLPGLLGMT
jgi:TRAP-type C4-dicarboxylate transport system permease large subunit